MTFGCFWIVPGAREYRFLKGEIELQEWKSTTNTHTIDHLSAKDAGSGYTCQAKNAVDVVMEAATPVTLSLGKMSELCILIFFVS